MNSDMDEAPRDGAPLLVRTLDGFYLLAKWAYDDFLGSDGEPCGGWVALEDDLHPVDWTDGVCWASNEDEVASDPPVAWLSVFEFAKAAAERSVYKSGTDNHARVYQGGYFGALAALKAITTALRDSDGSGEAGQTAKQARPKATARAEGIAQ